MHMVKLVVSRSVLTGPTRDREDHGLLYPGSRDYMTSEHVRLVMVIDWHYSAPS